MFLLWCYRIASFLATPILYIYIMKRRKEKKEDRVRYPERFGFPSQARPEGTVIWIHAASVGEAISMLPLMRGLVARFPEAHLLLTTGTVSSANLIQPRLPERCIHQFVPIDIGWTVQRFLNHWQPDLALLVESELWPNLITRTKNSCPMILINGRMSDPSYHKWNNVRPLADIMLKCFSLCLAQSEDNRKKFISLGAVNCKFIGNLKFDSPTLPADPKATKELLEMIGERYVLLAASTHANEEEMLTEIHRSLKQQHPNLLTIIVPRHAKRGKDIASDIKKAKLSVALRSAGKPIAADTDIYVADTMGELGIFYRLASVVFVGGSLIPHGGQNPLEPARLECAIVFGPHMENFLEIVEELEEAKACIKATDKDNLCQIIDTLIYDHQRQEQLAKNALAVVNKKAGMLDLTIRELEPYIHLADDKHQP